MFISICGPVMKLVLFYMMLIAGLAEAKVFLSVPQALSKQFDQNVQVQEKHAYLTKEDASMLNQKLGTQHFKPSLVTYFEGKNEKGQWMGRAFLEQHVIRKETQSLMIMISAQNKIEDVEVLSFNEPQSYFPKENWLSHLKNHQEKFKDVPNMTGATLTADKIKLSMEKIIFMNQKINEQKKY